MGKYRNDDIISYASTYVPSIASSQLSNKTVQSIESNIAIALPKNKPTNDFNKTNKKSKPQHKKKRINPAPTCTKEISVIKNINKEQNEKKNTSRKI